MLSLRISIICCSRSLIHWLSGVHTSWLPALQHTQITHFPLAQILPPLLTTLTATLLQSVATTSLLPLFCFFCFLLHHSRSLNLLHRLSWFLPQPLLLLFLKTYILSHFDYCDVVWFGCTKSESHCLESLVNFACCTVHRRCKHSSASAAHHNLGLSTLSSRKKIHLSQSVFKCLSSRCLSYLSQLVSGPNSSHHTQSSSSCQLNLPFTRSSFDQRSFSFTGASMWESLPANIREMKDFRAFSAKCEDFLLD